MAWDRLLFAIAGLCLLISYWNSLNELCWCIFNLLQLISILHVNCYLSGWLDFSWFLFSSRCSKLGSIFTKVVAVRWWKLPESSCQLTAILFLSWVSKLLKQLNEPEKWRSFGGPLTVIPGSNWQPGPFSTSGVSSLPENFLLLFTGKSVNLASAALPIHIKETTNFVIWKKP